MREQPEPDVKLLCRAMERLAYFLLDVDEDSEAIATAAAAVDVLPAEPPTRERASALATHARALLAYADTDLASARARRRRPRPQRPDAPWLQADALATLMSVRERAGLIGEAKSTGAKALELATKTDMAGVELRVRTCLPG